MGDAQICRRTEQATVDSVDIAACKRDDYQVLNRTSTPRLASPAAPRQGLILSSCSLYACVGENLPRCWPQSPGYDDATAPPSPPRTGSRVDGSSI